MPIPATLEKRCAACKETKPLAAFVGRTYPSGNKGTTTECKLCRNAKRSRWAQTERGREYVRANARRHYKKLRAAARMVWSLAGDPEALDGVRKAMVEHPPGLSTDQELLAYYRGFLAGNRRTAQEGERLARYQDLVFRIAAEEDCKLGKRTIRLAYEDMVSVGYEAVLEMLRKKGEPERALVAACIRRRFMDEARERFGRPGFGTEGKKAVYGWTGTDEEDGLGPLERAAAAEDHEPARQDLLERVRERLSGEDPRLAQIVEARLEGRLLREVASEMGISESRVCQLLKEAQPWLEEHILPLADSA